ncbi:MAG: DUF3110 domain-containing protein [Cyanobacteria bacterium P01_D01_bin.73]
MRVYVLLFNAGTENEGIHSLRLQKEDGGMRNVVLMFQEEDDATRFGVMLEAQDFPECTVTEIDEDEIKEFCEGAGYECKPVTSEMLLVPPESNLSEDEMDWNEEGKEKEVNDRPQESPQENSSELDSIRRRLENLL